MKRFIPDLSTCCIGCLAAVILIEAAAMAATVSLTTDPATGGPGKFAAEEIRREAAAKGMKLGDDAHTVRIAIALARDGKAAPQSYSIRVRNQPEGRCITVFGADPVGATRRLTSECGILG